MMRRPNVFVLCTGRCGSVTFVRAASHINNYTAGHESRTALAGPARFEFAPGHIEADNRLSWLLGRLDRAYGKSACYVHLQRDPLATARSFLRRWDRGIMRAYRTDILMGAAKREYPSDDDKLAYCLDYCDTVNRNIELFLQDKPQQMSFRLETAESDWGRFWDWIGAEGDKAAAVAEWRQRYNASE